MGVGGRRGLGVACSPWGPELSHSMRPPCGTRGALPGLCRGWPGSAQAIPRAGEEEGVSGVCQARASAAGRGGRGLQGFVVLSGLVTHCPPPCVQEALLGPSEAPGQPARPQTNGKLVRVSGAI